MKTVQLGVVLLMLFMLTGTIIYKTSDQSAPLQLSESMKDTYRSVAWHSLNEAEQVGVINHWKEADVSFRKNEHLMIFPVGEAQAHIFEKIRDKVEQWITVTFHTNHDERLRPITVVIHPGSGEVVGYVARF
ncbi:hypothetical protein LQV63_17640 [Paenibacillus profundus]|uniref:Uncharacterized protein n=1 Tax=Paenibacillus profundus TaxID=1173085 RepID=A0ABS8YLG2_9BACL|nr:MULTISPECIES: hypothetical protein [Paenibacillus]MCE5171127.1 hypothetical protein [Paenibacillus profundus]MCM3340046.1 hypothetical protein [Paenibacillus sp. MER TA 81-3]